MKRLARFSHQLNIIAADIASYDCHPRQRGVLSLGRQQRLVLANHCHIAHEIFVSAVTNLKSCSITAV